MTSLFNERQQGNFPSTSKVNPIRDGKEHCKAITLRSEKTVERPVQNNAENEDDDVESEENNAGNSRNNDETAGNSVGTIGKVEKLLKNSASKEQRKTGLKAPSKEDTSVIP